MGDRRSNVECNDSFARAKDAHHLYALYLDFRLRWLERDGNAEKVLLYTILQAIVRARELTSDDRDAKLPSADALRAALIPPPSKHSAPAAAAVLSEAEGIESAVEATAGRLVEILESPDFLDELDRVQPVEQRFKVLASLVAGLSESITGRDYLRRSVTRPLVSTGNGDDRIPAFHLSRLAEYDGDFLDERLVGGAKATATSFLKIAQEILPARFARLHITELEPVVVPFVDVISKFYPLDAVPSFSAWNEVFDVADGEVVIHEIRAFERQNPQWLKRLGAGAASLTVLTSSLDAVLQARKLSEDPSLANTVSFGHALAGIGAALGETAEAAARALGADVGEAAAVRLVAKVGTAASGLDVLLSAHQAMDEFAEGDVSAALGNMSLGASSLAFLAAGGAKAAGGTVVAVGLVGWTGIGVALLVIGILVVSFSQDDPPHPLVEAFEQTWFGAGWRSWRPPTNPTKVLEEVVSFRHEWKRADGSPVIWRQLSAMLQLLYPVRISGTSRKFIDGQFGPTVVVGIHPVLGHPNAYVELRLFDLGHSSRFVLPMAPPPGWIGPPWLARLTSVPVEDSRLWECELRISNRDFDRATWVEVTVSPPTRLEQRLLAAFDETLPDELATQLSLAPRERIVLDETQG